MFSSLDRVDLAGEEEGVKVFCQTDHRSAEEMDETPEVSVLFALVRTLLPRRLFEADGPSSKVRYVALSSVSAGVAEAVAATGSELESSATGESVVVPYDGAPRSVAEIADAAFRGLAHRVALRESLPISGIGLKALEERVLEAGWEFSEDSECEIEAWTALIELAAFTGECVRQDANGSWVVTEDEIGTDKAITAADFGLIPFVFKRQNGELQNAANKAMRAMTEPGQSVLQMLITETEEAREAGVAMLILKPPGWGQHGVLSRLLHEGLDDSPLVVVGQDMPNSIAYTTDDDRSPEAIELAFTEAAANVAKIEVEVEALDLEIEMDLLLVHGDFYAAEKILDESFMHSLHARMGQELLAVSVPVRGRLLVTAGVQSPDNLAHMMALTAGIFDKEADPISPLVFGVMNGKVSAVMRGESPEPTKKNSTPAAGKSNPWPKKDKGGW